MKLDDLIHGYLDGVLSVEEGRALNALLKNDPAAARRFAEVAVLHNALHEGFDSGEFAERYPEVAEGKVVSFRPRFSKVVPWIISAAAVVVALVAFKNPAESGGGGPVAEVREELRDSGFAVLTREVDAEWGAEEAPRQGDLLSSGSRVLKSGFAQIEFLSGVSVVVEAGTEFEILSPDEMRVVRGKLRAHVPTPAIGFQIHTPQGRVLDLGTEFALDFSEERSELHVLDGEVEWYAGDEEKRLLTAGHGLLLQDGGDREIAAQSSRFTTSGQLEERHSSHQGKRFAAWQAQSVELRKRPDLVAYFPMEEGEAASRELPATQEDLAPGAIVAAERVSGRWPGKSALDFSPNGSRVRVEVPGEFQALTFATWARIDSLDRQYNALFLTDNYEEGEPHWQITREGRLFFSVRLGGGLFHHINLSPVIWDHSMSKQWLHLVTTYDTATRTAVHFVNGEEVSREQAPPEKEVPVVRIGSAQIGNWGLPTKDEPEFAVRNLNGRLDEFAIFSTALGAAEVRGLYEAGKP